MTSEMAANQQVSSILKGAIIKAFFVIGSSILVFESARNSLTWHLTRFWGGAGDVWQSLWEKFLSFAGDDEYVLEVWGTYFITNLVYATVGFIYVLMDVTNKPSFLRKYKIQPDTNEPIDPKRLKGLLKTVFFNQAILNIPLIMLGAKAHRWRGRPDVHVLPEFHQVVLELIAFTLVEEVMFFYSHWALHHKLIYKHIHKKHHEWTASVGFVSTYAHPVEHFFSNLFPVFMGPFLCGSHIATGWLWYCLALLTTLNSHSGYHFPLLPSPEAHDFHHLKFNQCYGVLGILDYLHGTDTLFRSNKAYQRHIMSLSLTPLRELIPEDNDKITSKKFE